MKTALMIAGAVLVILGLHWIGQGTGMLVWRANPIVDNHIQWAYFGACVAVSGAVFIWYSFRRPN